MNGKKQFLLLGLLLLVALNVFLGHFWSYTVSVSAGIAVLLILSKLLAGITGMHFLL